MSECDKGYLRWISPTNKAQIMKTKAELGDGPNKPPTVAPPGCIRTGGTFSSTEGHFRIVQSGPRWQWNEELKLWEWPYIVEKIDPPEKVDEN